MSFTPFVTGEIGPYGASKRGPLLNFQSGSSIHPDQRIFSFGLGHHQVRKHPQPSCDVGWRRWHETHRQMFKRKGIHRFTRSWGKKKVEKKTTQQQLFNSSILFWLCRLFQFCSEAAPKAPASQLPHTIALLHCRSDWRTASNPPAPARGFLARHRAPPAGRNGRNLRCAEGNLQIFSVGITTINCLFKREHYPSGKLT